MELLGEIHLRGDVGFSAQPRKAFHWFLRAADCGCARAFYNLGLLFEEGNGVPSNLDLARHCYLRAAEKGDAEALIRLSELALSATGSDQDTIEAAKWLHLASRKGMGHASLLLTQMCQNGRLSQQQLDEAGQRADDFDRAFAKIKRDP
jgi:TPR repeat protein